MFQKTQLLFLFVIICLGCKAQSQFFMDSVFSSNLNEYRKITIYLPHGYKDNTTIYPVVYTTDGQSITNLYRKNIDSLIENKLTKPFILICSYSNEKPVGGVEYRNLDYKLMTYNPEFPLTIRFEQHMKFFTEELIRFAESNYRVSKEPEERLFYGTSNGADFGVSLAEDHPELIKNFILFSVFNGTDDTFKWSKRDRLYFYLGYGLKEPAHVKEEAVRMEKYFLKTGIPRTLVTWTGGHEQKEWQIAFVKALIRLDKNNSDRK